MSSKRNLYIVPKTLDAPVRFLGLPLEEAIPSLILAAFFFCINKIILSIFIPLIFIVIAKSLKKGRGSAWLVNLGYWYLPSYIIKYFLRKTPTSDDREYIA